MDLLPHPGSPATLLWTMLVALAGWFDFPVGYLLILASVLFGGFVYGLLSKGLIGPTGVVLIPPMAGLLLFGSVPHHGPVPTHLWDVTVPVVLSAYAGSVSMWCGERFFDRVQDFLWTVRWKPLKRRTTEDAEQVELIDVPHTRHSMVENVFHSILDEACAARAHFSTWRTFRNQAVMEYREEVRDYRYVDFFHISSSGHYELALLALSKVVDRDPGAAGFRKLRQVLREDGRIDLAQIAQDALEGREELAARIVRTRNQTMIHNQLEPTRSQFFIMSNVSPEEIRDLIDAACDALNRIGEALGYRGRVPPPDRHEEAVINLLEVVRAGREVHEL